MYALRIANIFEVGWNIWLPNKKTKFWQKSFFDKTAILSVNKKLKRKISNKIQINMHKQI